MTTYPLSEPATICPADRSDDASSASPDQETLGQGTLAECADIVAGMPPDRRASVHIQMDSLDLRFGPGEVGELLQFLREESAGLSNKEIAEIKDADQG